MKKFRHIILALTALILASCAVDEFWEGMDHAEGEEVVMTFKPRFEDFESVTKAIGDGSQVNQLLVHVYEEGTSSLDTTYTFEIKNCSIKDKVQIPFYYGKKYEVYFWAYKSGENSPYTISETGLKGGVSVNYPTGALAFDALESLDAFYAKADVNITKGSTMEVELTRPFAQVNLVADEEELLKAQASEVKFTINVAKTFNLTSPNVEEPTVEEPTEEESTEEQTFTFTITDNFQNTEEINGNVYVYLGTTYLFVPSSESEKVTGMVELYAGGNVLKSAANIEIPLVGNKRTNLVFSGFQVIVPDWNPGKQTVPGPSGGWITITEPEQLAALLMAGTTENTQVRIGSTLNMEKMPQDVKNKIVDKSFSSLTLDGNNLTIKNFSAPAFFANAAGLTVSDLVLDNFKVEGNDGHVGTLVNTLKGSSTFTNVTVSNSSATTSNGAAGGVVGYIVRNTPTSRSESVSVSFDNCHLSAVTATGSLTDGKFVGRLSGYDNREVVTFTTTCSAEGGNSSSMSKYVSSNLACWLTDDERSAFNGWIGDEVYYRGKVSYGDTRVAVKWDGTTTVEPLLANPEYDGNNAVAGTNKFAVYSPFDLAGVRKKTATPAAIYLMNNVDMFGQGKDGKYNIHPNFKQSAYESADDNNFTPFSSIAYLEGNNNCIYSLSLSTVGTNSYNSAFILSGGANHTHQNIRFNNCCTVVPHVIITNNDGTKEDKSYGATFIQSVEGVNYKMDNVHIADSKVFAIQKTGVLAGRLLSQGGATVSNCSVDNCYVENYECKDNLETFTGGSGSITATAQFYSYGEIGGLIGFVMYKATITGCRVSNTEVYAYGQDDKPANVTGFGSISIVNIQGRNVNEFIGDVRCVNSQTIEITNCSVSNNTCSQRNDVYTKSKNTYPIIGKAYYVGASIWLLFTTKKIGEDPGTLKVKNITNDGTQLFKSSTTVSLQSLIG